MNDQQAGERLESWKKIAAYLKRDVRTVQRWEQANGLPVHRFRRGQRAIPYAYASEIDSWWRQQSQSPESAASLEASARASRQRRLRDAVVVAAASLVVAALVVIGITTRFGFKSTPAKSVAVLPFIDLSEGMANEEFADGLSEEIIEKLARIDGLKVPAPASSFRFKYKEIALQEIARSLDVAYAVDGSVRKSGERVRIVARLMRADDAAVVWSKTYDLPWNDILVLQDDIARQVSGAVQEQLE